MYLKLKFLFLLFTAAALVFAGCGGSSGSSGSNETYKVTYNVNSTSATGAVPVDSGTYSQGQTVSVLGNTGDLQMTGCSFTGWNTKANGTGTTYIEGQGLQMGAADINLYAVWTDIPNV